MMDSSLYGAYDQLLPADDKRHLAAERLAKGVFDVEVIREIIEAGASCCLYIEFSS